MEQTLSVTPRKMSGKIPVIILAVFAIVCRVGGYLIALSNILLSFFNPVVDYIFSRLDSGRSIDIDRIFDQMGYILEDNVMDLLGTVFSTTFFMIKDVIPVILFVAYIAFCYKKSKATILLPITFGALCLGRIIGMFSTIITYIMLILDYGFDMGYVLSLTIQIVITVLMEAPFIIVYILLTVSSLKGFVNKPLAIVPCTVVIIFTVGMMALSAIYIVLQIISHIFGIVSINLAEYAIVSSLISLLGTSVASLFTISFFVAVIILAAKNYIPEIIPMSDAKLDALMQKKPTKALEILKMRYECGKISEEEYNSRISASEAPVSAE